MYEYKATVIKVIDGDTVDVDLDLGFDVMLKKERVRIMGIDTPESRTRDKEEKKFGLASKARLKELLGKDTVLVCQKYDAKGKFGRILGDFKTDSGLAGKRLIEEGHAVPYHGQAKKDVDELHMNNRARLIAEGKVK